MVEVVADRGHSETRVMDVVGAAGVSRATFYELFTGKEDCLLTAFEVALGDLMDVTTNEFQSSADAPWSERVRRAMAAFLFRLAERPAMARFCLVEVLAAGPKAVEIRDAALRRFARLIDSGGSEGSEVPAITPIALVGGVHQLVYGEILHGATAQLPSRLPDLVYLIVSPYLGPKAAAAEREVARASLARGLQ